MTTTPSSRLSRIRTPLTALLLVAATVVACGGGEDTATDAPAAASGAQGGTSAGKGGTTASGGSVQGAAGQSTMATGGGAQGGKAQGGMSQGGSSQGGAAQGGTAQGGAGQAGMAGSSGQPSGGGAGKGGDAGAASGDISCESTNDCAPYIPETKPAGCATATCDLASKKCRFKAKDFDGDGHGTTSCKSLDASITIELGDDCDDTNDKVHPDAWDGPEGEGHTSACDDGLDNDCDGKPDDDALSDSTGCKCVVGDTQKCANDGGQPIVFPGGTPQGECRYGSQTCIEQNGKTVWGSCANAVGPGVEICDKKDNDCDGEIDEDALNKKKWYWDADGDSHADPSFPPVIACEAPATPPEGCKDVPHKTKCEVNAGSWKNSILADDCDDTDASANPEAPEVCDEIDNDCDGKKNENAINAPTWYLDEDGDGHLLRKDLSTATKPVKRFQCAQPGAMEADCPAGLTTCTERWFKEGTADFDDCDDGNERRFPGNWDGPEARVVAYGIVPPGLGVTFFNNTPADNWVSPIPEATGTSLSVNEDWGLGSPHPAVPVDHFTAAWSGKFVPPKSGDFTFRLNIDPGAYAAIYVDGVQYFCLGSTGPCAWVIPLTAGTTYQLDVHVPDHGGRSKAQLTWETQDFPQQVLSTQLSPPGGAKPSSCDNEDNDCSGPNDDELLTDLNIPGLKFACGACNPLNTDPSTFSTRPCGNQAVGECHPGSQTCRPDGTYGDCAGERKPIAEICNGDGRDYNCNTILNTEVGDSADCSCTTGAPRPCNQLKGPGWCGTATCTMNKWIEDACYPGTRQCNSAGDNDCDNQPDNIIDETYCKCPIGEQKPCPTYEGHDASGACIHATSTCTVTDGKSDWSLCGGATSLGVETCQSQTDVNCDGRVGNAPGCIKLVYLLESNSWWGCSNTQGDLMISEYPDEGGYIMLGHMYLWSWGNLPVRRCYCGDHHTAVINEFCPPACTDEGVFGYLSATNGPGKEPAMKVTFPGSQSEGICSGWGCLSAMCGASLPSVAYAPLPP